ncbi:MAG: hypothetical protein GWP10_17570 [Nitrospiraceae bacterium]|nr:hypothetical protein [Nitrospiraceae bacterium]
MRLNEILKSYYELILEEEKQVKNLAFAFTTKRTLVILLSAPLISILDGLVIVLP